LVELVELLDDFELAVELIELFVQKIRLRKRCNLSGSAEVDAVVVDDEFVDFS
jgi:hypothetical protein